MTAGMLRRSSSGVDGTLMVGDHADLMTGGLPAVDVRRTGTIAVALLWGVAALAAIARFGLVRGVLLAGWVLPLVAGVAVLVTQVLVHSPRPAEVTTRGHEPRSSSAA